jgi:ketosteroid isomerase-like protein
MSQENVDRAKRAYAATNDAYGLPIEFAFVHVGTYRDGKIVRLDVYANLDALEAAGVEE